MRGTTSRTTYKAVFEVQEDTLSLSSFDMNDGVELSENVVVESAWSTIE